jgi:hypothetical protein
VHRAQDERRNDRVGCVQVTSDMTMAAAVSAFPSQPPKRLDAPSSSSMNSSAFFSASALMTTSSCGLLRSCSDIVFLYPGIFAAASVALARKRVARHEP